MKKTSAAKLFISWLIFNAGMASVFILKPTLTANLIICMLILYLFISTLILGEIFSRV